MFQPRHLKRAKLLHKGVTRFLNYKRDLLPQARLEEIEKLRAELRQATREQNRGRLESLTDEINRACDRALPQARTGWLAENIEVFFVSIVIALGIRAYIAQPFQIPTGSMQPTLNGITAERIADGSGPGLLRRLAGFFTGTSYLDVVSNHDGYIDVSDPELKSAVTEHHFLIFRPYCYVHFTDGHRLKINSPKRQLFEELGFLANLRVAAYAEQTASPDMRAELRARESGQIRIRRGQLLARGIVRNGDHVIVNKFAYHFRRPARGEVFVFTTKNIGGPFMRVPREQGSQHYIKRLAGVPGDTLDVQPPELLIDGKPAREAGFRRVIDNAVPPNVPMAYHGYSADRHIRLPITLGSAPRAEYFALGDNSYNSSDSRYWGPVPQQNVVGPGWFCYWPLTRHFGPIR